MKYKAIIVLLAICLTCLLPLQADAAQILDGGELRGGLTWSVDSTGTLTISGEGDLSTDTGIMDMASPWYAYFDRITTIVIEEGITSIDAMGNLTGLTTVILPESLKSIGYKAFSGCRSLTTIHLPGSLTSIGKNAFYGCAALNGMVIPEGVTAIGNGAFARCTGLQSVTIPVSVKKVGSGAFDGCTGLTDVYYTGTEAAWSGIAIEANNQHLLAASIHYSAHAAHNFTAVVTEPGCTTQGYTTYTCTCGEQYVSDVTEVRWHSYAWSSESNGIVTMVCTECGDYHYNYTGASLGGLGVSDTAYLVAGNSIRQDGTVPVDGQRNIFLTVTDKGDFSRAGTTLEWLTHHGDNANVAVSTPHLVTVSSDRFCVLWTEDGVLHYTFINGEGQQVTEVFVSLQGMLSDCVPICADGKLIWYVSHRFKSSYACDYRFVKMFSIDLADPDLVMVKDVFYETQHLWSEWETVQEPGNGVHGLRERTCSRCGQTEQAEIPKLKHRPGDLNGDSRVNGLDLVLLRQYLADWAVEPDLGGADCNGDTRVNGLDLILLRQYLAGWDVRLAS